MSLLYDEHPLIVNPGLATLIGLNEAIVLQQVHYWIEIEKKTKDQEVIRKHFHGDKWWIYNTFEQWQEQFPFWSVPTIKRSVKKLKDMGLLISGNFNRHGYDRTSWYTIDYEALESLENKESIKLILCKGSNCNSATNQSDTSNTIDFTETSNKESIKCTMVQNSENLCTTPLNDFSYEIVENQISRICFKEYDDIDMDLVLKTIMYYLRAYERYRYCYHPKMQNQSYRKVIEFINNNKDLYEFDDYRLMIDKHFVTNYGKKIDYKITHFFTEGIVENRMYEVMYG